ncbi:MAG: serine/threonine-protein kinase [Labilithrix sp.]
MTIREGAMLRDRWRIDEKIGRGTMATVWAATHRNGDRVAIKVLHPELVHEGSVKQRFLREAYVANAIAHPGVVRVIDDDALPDGSPFLVMDLLEGETLESYRQKLGGKLPPAEVADVLDQLLDTLDAAHRKNVVHRDLKPENLFRERDGRIRILDFGLARLLEGNDFATQTGALLGTPEFMAPEQAAGKTAEVDARTDLWAVGATGFLLFSGYKLYDADNLPMLLNAILSKPPRRLATVAPEIGPEIARVIDGALVRDKNQRWQTADEMRSALRAATGGSSRAVEDAHTVSSRDPYLPEPVTHKMERAGEDEARTTLREAAAPLAEPETMTIATPRPMTRLPIPSPANARISPRIVSDTEAMQEAPVRPPPPVTKPVPEPVPTRELTPAPAPLPRTLAQTRVQPISAPEPMRAPPPPPPKSMSLLVLLGLAVVFAIGVTAVVIVLNRG